MLINLPKDVRVEELMLRSVLSKTRILEKELYLSIFYQTLAPIGMLSGTGIKYTLPSSVSATISIP